MFVLKREFVRSPPWLRPLLEAWRFWSKRAKPAVPNTTQPAGQAEMPAVGQAEMLALKDKNPPTRRICRKMSEEAS
jgi:hypothetical protein